MRLWIAPSIRSRRAVPNGGPHLSVAYDLACFVKVFDLFKVLISRSPSIRSRRVISNGGPHLSVAYDLTIVS